MHSCKKKLAIIYKINILCALFLGDICAADQAAYVLNSWKFLNNDSISNSSLERVSGFETGSLIDDAGINESLKKIKELYLSKGFYFAEIGIEKYFDSTGRLELLYMIKEGVRVRIGEINFSGNALVPSRILMGQIESRKSKWIRKGYLDEALLEQDRQNINAYYEQNSLEGRVIDVVKKFSQDGQTVNIVFVIRENTESVSEKAVIDDIRPEAEEKPLITVSPPSESAAEKRISELEYELKNLSSLLKDRQDVETLLSGMLTAEKAAKRQLEEENLKLKNKIAGLEDNLKISREEEKTLRTELETRKSREREILDRNDSAEKKLDAINSLITLKLREIEKIKDNLTDILADTRTAIAKELDRVELAEVTIEKAQLPEEPVNKTEDAGTSGVKATDRVRISGKVVVVNSDLNFVVSNVGASSGVYNGMKFDVMRGGIPVGKVKVIEVRKNISASDIYEKKQPVMTGDEVIEITG